MSEKKILGIIGGLGPMAGVSLCELLVLHTAAKRDQDHIDFLLSSRARALAVFSSSPYHLA